MTCLVFVLSPLARMVSGVGLFASGIFGTHMWRPQGERAGASPSPGGAYSIFSLGYNQGAFFFMYFVHLSYIFCTFT